MIYLPPQVHPRTKILLVEDEPVLLELCTYYLEEAGYTVGAAHSGMMGLRKFREERWDAVVTDRAMLEMSGEVMSEAIKALMPELPIVMVTGLPGAIERPELYSIVLPKPFLKADLLLAVETALGGPCAMGEEMSRGCRVGGLFTEQSAESQA